MSDILSITVSERMYMVLIDMLVWLNTYITRRDLVDHNCKSMRIKCDMLERECGAPWSLLISERRERQSLNS